MKLPPLPTCNYGRDTFWISLYWLSRKEQPLPSSVTPVGFAVSSVQRCLNGGPIEDNRFQFRPGSVEPK